MSPGVEAALIAGGVGVLTLIGTLVAQFYGIRSTRSGTDKTLDQLDKTLAQQRDRTLNERFATAADRLGSDKPPAVRLAGVYAMAGLADDWPENRQTCVDILCAYLRLPYDPDPGDDAHSTERAAYRANREVRHTIIRLICTHLRPDAGVSWQGLNLDFTNVVFDGGNFIGARFSGGIVRFSDASFASGTVSFKGAAFSGGEVSFDDAKFSGKVSFEGAKFSSGKVSFDDAKFSSGKVSFEGAKFSGGEVSFGKAYHMLSDVVWDEIVTGDAVFSGGEVSFDRAEFSDGVVHFNSVFSGSKVSFYDAKFSGSLVSFGWVLSARVYMGGAEFSGGEVIFDYAEFSGSKVSFGNAKFSGSKVSFGNAKLSGGEVSFEGAKFSGSEVSFEGAKFSGSEVSFRYPGDWSQPPMFNWDRTPPEGIKLPADADAGDQRPG